jgi:nucleotide-binding universal stress UspA family protein
MRRYLVVANQTLGGDELVQAIRDFMAAGPSEFWIVVPATPAQHLIPAFVPPMPVMGGPVALPPPPEEGRRLAEAKLRSAVEQLRAAGATADGEVGDPDPMRAVEEALGRRDFDEIIVSTLPARLSHWLHQDLPWRIEHKFRLPVTHISVTKVSRH